jgi:hypothetical protein
MSNKKQTAVEWLVEQYTQGNYSWEAYEKAKEMDKEQKMDAFMEGDSFEGRASKKDFDQYYTETYNTSDK